MNIVVNIALGLILGICICIHSDVMKIREALRGKK